MKTQPWILDFEAAAKSGTAVVGGKGYHLGLLVRYGLPVPEGFVLSTQALEQVLLSNLAITMPAAAASSEELRQFQAAFAALPFPEDIRVELVRALEQRGWSNTAFAVRSSAPMEDSNVASFAGIHDSVLDVVGIDALISAIKTVWVSLWSPQAVSYRQRLGISQAGMAVVVMPMVRAVSAGVAFSCDPVSGRYDRITINAVRGLADSLVSGQVQGEDITFESGTFSDRYQLVQRQGPHCGLDDGQLETLAALIQDTAFALDYASPWYDIEWVWDGEQFFLVQARPITSRPLHTYEGLRGTSSLWSNSNTRDVIPHPMRAGEWALARHMASAMLAPTWQLIRYSTLPGLQRASLFNGRLYLSTALIQWEAFDAFGVRPSEINSLLGGHVNYSEIVNFRHPLFL